MEEAKKALQNQTQLGKIIEMKMIKCSAGQFIDVLSWSVSSKI